MSSVVKKISLILLSCVLVLSFAACKKKPVESQTGSPNDDGQSQVTSSYEDEAEGMTESELDSLVSDFDKNVKPEIEIPGQPDKSGDNSSKGTSQPDDSKHQSPNGNTSSSEGTSSGSGFIDGWF